MQFHFGDNERVMKEWRLTRDLLEAYGQCAETTYRQFLKANAPEGACVPARDSAVAAIDTFIGELLREYRQMEALR
jgi:hypothetical protein